jgi:hypothetical protein
LLNRQNTSTSNKGSVETLLPNMVLSDGSAVSPAGGSCGSEASLPIGIHGYPGDPITDSIGITGTEAVRVKPCEPLAGFETSLKP